MFIAAEKKIKRKCITYCKLSCVQCRGMAAFLIGSISFTDEFLRAVAANTKDRATCVTMNNYMIFFSYTKVQLNVCGGGPILRKI